MKAVSGTLLLASLFMAAASVVQAEKVSMTLPSGLLVNAEYSWTNPTQPTLLILHGFLQTREFQATKNIIDGLADMDYEVLGPSLSLGIGNRRKSLSCEALHMHTLDNDLEELDLWVDWLLQNGHPSVVLIGHSWGGQHALAYVEKYPERPIAGVMAVSLVRSRQDEATLAAQDARAEARLKAGESEPDSYALNFCKKYTGTPQSYLSYAEWTDSKVVAAVKAAQPSVHVILGGDDRRIDSAWVTALENAGAKVTMIDGADHFFSSQYEFDLIDELEHGLSALLKPDPS